ncbi:N-acetylmuramoyl-L-alanine amidase [Dongia sp.]|uniref:N-acetylmuramoyl-L-alanine amidase n=1 Tax=Dongia sp. TaxID=1977262 RepID=UPI0035ADD3E2
MIDAPSPNHDSRDGQPVDILLMHYTGMQTGEAAIARLRDTDAKVSAHYVVEEDGRVFRLVPEDRRAWHAGVSSWKSETNINQRSIGIEIVNPGHEFGYRPFPAAQMQAVRDLSLGIIARHAIHPARVIGHSDVAPKRKEDPGEFFDWQGLAAAGIGVWPVAKPVDWDSETFFAALARYGYDIADRAAAARAFCRHFRQASLADAPDAEMAALLNGLLERV